MNRQAQTVIPSTRKQFQNTAVTSNATVHIKAGKTVKDIAFPGSSPSRSAGCRCLQSTVSGVTCVRASDPVRCKTGQASLAVFTRSQARRSHTSRFVGWAALTEEHRRKNLSPLVAFGASRDSHGRGLSMAGAYSPLWPTIHGHFLSQLLFQSALVVLQF